MNCWHCNTMIEVSERVGFRDCCPGCDRALHACRNCTLYDPAYHNQCRETMAPLLPDKERGNFCEFFAPCVTGSSADRSPTAAASRPQGTPAPGGTAREKLEELFKRKR